MTPSDDEVVARLRASFEVTAARTPISSGRFDAIAAAQNGQKRSNTMVVSMSAAAAVVVIAAVTTVVANSQSGGTGQLVPAAGAPSGSTVTGTPVASDPTKVGDGCVPQNDYVIASQAQLAGLTYLLPASPPGYHLYGAWGTIDRSMCADTATWYVEYDDVAGDGNTDNMAIQLTAHRSEPGESYPPQVPGVALTKESVGGQPAELMGLNGKGVGVLLWASGGVNLQLIAPMTDGSSTSILALADSIVAVPANDPRIKPPAGCEVPFGGVCVSSSPLAKMTPSATPNGEGGVSSEAPRTALASLAVG